MWFDVAVYAGLWLALALAVVVETWFAPVQEDYE